MVEFVCEPGGLGFLIAFWVVGHALSPSKFQRSDPTCCYICFLGGKLNFSVVFN